MGKELSIAQSVERSIIKNYRTKLWSPFIKAIKEFDLLKENDKVCVCISGGKDSMLMAKLFQELKRHSDFDFEVMYLVMDPGYNEKHLDLIRDNIEKLEIDAKIVKTNIFDVSEKLSENPCYLCARMRRGALYKIAKENGCNKIALGHHFNDVIETTLMNMLNVGSFQTMLPKLHSENYEDMELIRPMYFVKEKDIINWVKHNNLEFIACACKFVSSVEKEELESKRKQTKELIKELRSYNINVEKNIYKATLNVNMNMILGYKKGKERHNFLDDYDKK